MRVTTVVRGQRVWGVSAQLLGLDVGLMYG
jgi:hypothetical protein